MDVAKAVAFIFQNYKSKGQVFIAGSSAGAYIAMMLLMDSHYLEDVGILPDDIAGYISESAQITAHFNVLKSRGFDEWLERIDETAPIYYLNDKSRLRPLLLMFYLGDMPCRKEENLLFSASVKRFFPEAEITVAEIDGNHCCPTDRQQLIDSIYAFIKSC